MKRRSIIPKPTLAKRTKPKSYRKVMYLILWTDRTYSYHQRAEMHQLTRDPQTSIYVLSVRKERKICHYERGQIVVNNPTSRTI